RSSVPAAVGLKAPKAVFAALRPPSAICPVTMGVQALVRIMAKSRPLWQIRTFDRFHSIASSPAGGPIRPERAQQPLFRHPVNPSSHAKTPAFLRLARLQERLGGSEFCTDSQDSHCFPQIFAVAIGVEVTIGVGVVVGERNCDRPKCAAQTHTPIGVVTAA